MKGSDREPPNQGTFTSSQELEHVIKGSGDVSEIWSDEFSSSAIDKASRIDFLSSLRNFSFFSFFLAIVASFLA
jgi:hypothetical protein